MKVVGIIFIFLTALSSLNSNKWLEISHQISAAVSVFSDCTVICLFKFDKFEGWFN
jgi:hypothetical protein